MLGVEPRAWCIPSMHSTTEPHPQPKRILSRHGCPSFSYKGPVGKGQPKEGGTHPRPKGLLPFYQNPDPSRNGPGKKANIIIWENSKIVTLNTITDTQRGGEMSVGGS